MAGHPSYVRFYHFLKLNYISLNFKSWDSFEFSEKLLDTKTFFLQTIWKDVANPIPPTPPTITVHISSKRNLPF